MGGELSETQTTISTTGAGVEWTPNFETDLWIYDSMDSIPLTNNVSGGTAYDNTDGALSSTDCNEYLDDCSVFDYSNGDYASFTSGDAELNKQGNFSWSVWVKIDSNTGEEQHIISKHE